jgi:hypothetical protein
MSGINNRIVGDPTPPTTSALASASAGDPIAPENHFFTKTNGNLKQVTSGNKGGYRKRKLSRRHKNKKRNTRRRR